MKRNFKFKIRKDGYHYVNPVFTLKVDVELRENEDGLPVFSMSGDIYSPHHRCLGGGQCFDEYLEWGNTSILLRFLVETWKEHHLNDMHAGTPEQEKCLADNQAEVKAVQSEMAEAKAINCDEYYPACCEVLRRHELYDVDVNGQPYTYGHGWLYKPIPPEILEKIRYCLDQRHTEKDIENYLK
ncbi:MAG: hypothetical protein J6Y37_13580 [Paludibacteraceae bacterium]|nr:hypothetical protein [Paludibacteraceae bacterium]